MAEHMDVRRPKQKVRRQIRRSTIALDEYMFERKMQSLYYGKKPKSDDTPAFVQWIRRSFKRLRGAIATVPRTIPQQARRLAGHAKRYPSRYVAGVLAIALLAVFIAPRVHLPRKQAVVKEVLGEQKDGAAGATSGESKSRIPLDQTPEFSTVLPQGKTAKDLGGFAKVSPPGAPSAYAYKDKIGAVDILVTQQLLPESMKAEPGASVEKIAIGYNANFSVKTEKSQFFIGTSEGGEQSVIAYTKTLLILIKSSGKITNDRWQEYIEDLK